MKTIRAAEAYQTKPLNLAEAQAAIRRRVGEA